MGGIERFPSLSNSAQDASDKEGKKGSILLQYLEELVSYTVSVRGFAVLTLGDQAKNSCRVEKFFPIGALHFLIFELSINQSQRAGSPMEVSLIFQQNNRTYPTSQCISYQLCCFLSRKIFRFLHPHCTAECDPLTENQRNSHQTHDGSLSSSQISFL